LNQIAVQNNNTSDNASTNSSANATLWNWGRTPVGYTLSKSGMLTPFEDSGEWTPSIWKPQVCSNDRSSSLRKSLPFQFFLS
jgi:hypothetical protein